MCNLGGNYMNRIVKTGVYTRNGEDHDFNFYTSLSAIDKIKFVNVVTSTLVGDNYYSFIKDMIFDIAIVHIFTDVDVSDIMLSNNAINEIENYLNETNIVEIVKVNVDFGVIEELNKGVDDNIEYRTGIHKNPIAESLSHLLNTIDKKVSGVDTDKMMEMAQVISNMSGELTPDKMLEAYSKSDLFKQNYEKIMAERNRHNNDIEDAVTDIKNAKNRKKVASVK